MDETFEHQNLRGQQTLNFKAICAAALTAGGVTFIMSGGAPWTTAGTMNAVMGRHFDLNVLGLLALHIAVAFVYSSVISAVIYRLSLWASLATGLLVGMGLYAINYLLLHQYSVTEGGSPEIQAAGAHFTFSLIASAVYRAASVPRRIVNAPPSVADAPVEGRTDRGPSQPLLPRQPRMAGSRK